ncbi:glycosyltransferase [Cryobacterium sp. TMB1-7]|uniref:glycosyltransferase n=1 Tax=Cryobacterium sp. TMB1-7 TaxID=2555866 RepID=UPI001069EEC2|nr:glycosyltransferase family 2 protein [Cryobacterium sp. TMB1-7]TFC59916.1 glycosyltransferase family 2 protein [Cryobacterium sp. TMB1-7]
MSSANVVTVLYNNVSTLAGFLSGLEAQHDFVAQVVLVDNASTDDTLEQTRALAAASSLDITVVANANTGFAGGYARGGTEIRNLTLPTLCLNPDVELEPGALERMLSVLGGADRIGIVTAPLVIETGEPDTASRRVLPTLGKAAVYAVLGRLTPPALRYNRRQAPSQEASPVLYPVGDRVTAVEATTGALMLVNPGFRTADKGIFDQDYWMYGEDLQLCADARSEGWQVLMAEGAPSVHTKGVSSGRPRGKKSNIEFHRAMYTYYVKNLNKSRVGKVGVGAAILTRLGSELAISAVMRARQARAAAKPSAAEVSR